VRVLYGFPTGVGDELLAALAETPAVCRYLDVPIQHSHPDVLKAMGRADTVACVREMPDRVRRALPDATLRTTCLVGHPGEDENRFRHLVEHVEAAQYDHLGVFVFSPEEGTPAAALPGRPSRAEAEERRARLLEAQWRIVARRAANRVGRVEKLLLERPPRAGRRAWSGRTARFAPDVDGEVLVHGVPPDARPGTFVEVRYTGAEGYDMVACHVKTARA
jgi:ribosomal protein S12 methylthiotransferase